MLQSRASPAGDSRKTTCIGRPLCQTQYVVMITYSEYLNLYWTPRRGLCVFENIIRTAGESSSGSGSYWSDCHGAALNFYISRRSPVVAARRRFRTVFPSAVPQRYSAFRSHRRCALRRLLNIAYENPRRAPAGTRERMYLSIPTIRIASG